MHPQLVGCTMQQLLSICEDHDGGRQVASFNTKRAYFEKKIIFPLTDVTSAPSFMDSFAKPLSQED